MGDLEEAGPTLGPAPRPLGERALTDNRELTALIEPVVKNLGFELVRVMFGGGEQTLQVMAEDPATGQLTIDQCATISRALSDMLDEADPIESEYRLEVSSPGIDRPLTRAKDWADWVGHEARLQVRDGAPGRKRFNGIVRGVEGDKAKLEVGGEELSFPLDAIQSAKLTLTDALIKATRPLSSEGADEIEEEDE